MLLLLLFNGMHVVDDSVRKGIDQGVTGHEFKSSVGRLVKIMIMTILTSLVDVAIKSVASLPNYHQIYALGNKCLR